MMRHEGSRSAKGGEMRTGLIGRKLGMSQMFTESGRREAVTLILVGPCAVVARKTVDKDGYNAIQVGFDEMKPSRVSKPLKGEFAKAKVTPRRILKEFRVDDPEAYAIGSEIDVTHFAVDAMVDISGESVGKGFAGVMKRWGFRGLGASHGAHKVHRSGGSIGQCQTPGRVFKNKKMAGHMGTNRVTVQNLKVARVDANRNILVVNGSIPGHKGTIVLVRDAVKKA